MQQINMIEPNKVTVNAIGVRNTCEDRQGMAVKDVSVKNDVLNVDGILTYDKKSVGCGRSVSNNTDVEN